MTVSDIESETPGATDEEIQVVFWRAESLLRAGYEADAAVTLALESHVDLHAAVELLSHGCNESTALRILL